MNVFEILSIFDWITPAMNLTKCVRGMRPISVCWSRGTPEHYRKVLRRHGVKADAGGIVAGKGFILLVPKADVARAWDILADAGADVAR